VGNKDSVDEENESWVFVIIIAVVQIVGRYQPSLMGKTNKREKHPFFFMDFAPIVRGDGD
jgi:hypothetical protein